MEKKRSSIDSARNKLHASCHLVTSGLLSRGMYAIVFLYVPFILRRIIDSLSFLPRVFQCLAEWKQGKFAAPDISLTHDSFTFTRFSSSLLSPFVSQRLPFLLLSSTFRCTLVLRATFANNER